MNTTVRIKASQIYKDWHVIDAAGRPLGRVATEAAILLRGKHKPTYEPHLDDGDFVIVINASQVRVTGRKAAQIKYYSHSGYPGGLKTRSYEDQLAQYPERVLEKAIWGMLPGGPLGKAMFRHLKVYKNANHPHQSQLAGSAKAQEARPAVTAPGPAKPARLRPLSVPQVLPEPVAKVAPAPRPAAVNPVKAAAKPTNSAKPASRTKAPKDAKAATTNAEMAAQGDTVLSSETPSPAQPLTVGGKTTVDYGTPTPAEAAITAGAATAATESAEKAPTKKAVEPTTKAAAKAVAKEPAKAATKAPAKAATKTSAKAVTKTPAKATAKTLAKAATEEKKPAPSRAAKTEE